MQTAGTGKQYVPKVLDVAVREKPRIYGILLLGY